MSLPRSGNPHNEIVGALATKLSSINNIVSSRFQCKNDLKSDEEIFAEKAREVNNMVDMIEKLVSVKFSNF